MLYTDFLKLMADNRYSEVLQWFRDYLKAREKEKTGAKLTVCIWSYIPRAYLVVSNNLTKFLCIGERTRRHSSYICNSILAGTGLEEKEQANLGDIMKFLTGARTIPPRGYAFNRKLLLSYNQRRHPESSCFLNLSLPLGCTDFKEFCDNFDKAVLWSLAHFGQM